MRYLAIGVLLLAGCATPEQIARHNHEQAQRAQMQRIMYQDGLMTSCESIGYRRDTDPWRQCIMQLHGQNQAQQSAAHAAILGGLASQPRNIPSCRSLPPGTAGYAYAGGNCR